VAIAARTGDWRDQALIPQKTIFALSSGSLPAGIAVVRISGPCAASALETLTGRAVPLPRTARLGTLRDHNGLVLDRALTLWFPGPMTATGEDVAELHLHGGRAVVDAVLTVLEGLPGLRPAEPGAFTRRAFENGRIDLAEAEALGDLLRAETEAQRRHAILQLEGGLTRLVDDWQTMLTGLSARIEAILDHGDEGDVDANDLSAIFAEAQHLAKAIGASLAQPPAERLHDGIRIVIAGAPNAGKSSLINTLAGREAAIVAPVAGTTRDVIEVPLVWAGVPFIVSDTAGLRESTDDPVEATGIARARALVDVGDIVIALDDTVPFGPNVLRIDPKCDLPSPRTGHMAVSAKTGEGLPALRNELVRRARALLPAPDGVALNARHRTAIREALDALEGMFSIPDPLLVAEHLRLARTALDRVTGAGDTEAMLDALFGRFCIGK
jgi:tRNA modification GTPase